MWNHHPKIGFRISAIDIGVLLVTAAVTCVAVPAIGDLGWLPLFVVGHFFLFCNVFRIRRRPELIWAGWFVAVCVTLSVASQISLPTIAVLVIPLTIVLLALEMRHPTYHGILTNSTSAWRNGTRPKTRHL